MRAWLLFLILISSGSVAQAVESHQHMACDSCLFQINNLDKPYPLKGNWLFTNTDQPDNRNPNISIDDWRVIATPGNWEKAYENRQLFRVGWYRGVLEFDKELIGKEIVFLVDVYMSQIQFFLDGEEIYSRRKGKVDERFYSIQPIPIRFKITQQTHVVAFRIDTMLMTGVYQLPFQLREYRENDIFLAAFQTWGGEVRLISAYVILAFGIFFLILFYKIRYLIYLVAGLSGVLIYPFYAFPSDSMIRFFNPESLQILHYIGIGYMALFHSFFAQFFYKFYPRINIINTVVILIISLSFPLLLVKFDLQAFQILRKVLFLYSLIIASHYIYVCFQATRKHHQNMVLLVCELIFYFSSIHDTLLALGIIKSVALIFTGTVIATFGIMIKASQIFANTFVENKSLLKKIEKTNRNLEKIVQKRTHQLEVKSDNIRTILTQVPAGILTLDEQLKIGAEYSKHLEVIFGRKNLTGLEIIDQLFKHSDLSGDQISRLSSTLICSVGEDVFNFEANYQSLPAKITATINGVEKTLEMEWAPVQNRYDKVDKILLVMRDVTLLKQLEKNMKRNQRDLEIIGEILRIPREKYFDCMISINKLIRECEETILDSQPTLQSKSALCLQRLHTVKGLARTYHLTEISDLVHEVESDLHSMNKEMETSEPKLTQSISTIQKLIDAYETIFRDKLDFANDSDKQTNRPNSSIDDRLFSITKFLEKNRIKNIKDFTKVIQFAQIELMEISGISIDAVIQPIVESLPSLAAELGKPSPSVTIQCEPLVFKRQVADQARQVLIHIFRNIIDHGIEDAETRIQENKPKAGLITIQGVLGEVGLLLRIWDDGQGLNLQKLRTQATRHGIIDENQAYADNDIARLIFQDGLSTKNKVSEVSGRGVGMSFVKQTITDMGGNIEIILRDSKKSGQPHFCFEITLPTKDIFVLPTEAMTSPPKIA